MTENLDTDYPLLDVQRENPIEFSDSLVLDEPIELIDETPSKKRSTWCQDIQ